MKAKLDEKTTKSLKEYFNNEQEVVLAFLFGSFAKGFANKDSDFDVAVYLKSEQKESAIWLAISKIIKKEVDLICLNMAPATLVSAVFKTGIPLAIKDKKLYWELYLQKSLEAEDFVKFAEDFWRVKQKAKSLSPEQKTRALERMSFLTSELKERERFSGITFREYQEDKPKRREVERWTENILNATIDIAKIILASEKKEMPRSYEDALFDLAFFIGFSKEESEEFSRLAQLRNILAHEYLDILYGKIQNFVKESPGFYPRIIDFLDNYLK
ncbi:MAG: HepT-like ribonuclease domain-containing protein [Patescibacteria group bacterium]